MLCSSCSEPIKPVVAIDIDGTLGDYHSHFLLFASRYLGDHLSLQYDGKPGFKEWFCAEYGVDERTWRDIKLAYRQGAQKRSMPEYQHASMLCYEVRLAGAELWLTTTRPYLRLDNIDPDTRAWLSRHRIEYDGLIYDEAKYERLLERVDPERVVAVLDDLPEQFEEAAKAFGWKTPILRRTRYNEAIPCHQAASSCWQAQNIILERINDWRERHEGNSPRST